MGDRERPASQAAEGRPLLALWVPWEFLPSPGRAGARVLLGTPPARLVHRRDGPRRARARRDGDADPAPSRRTSGPHEPSRNCARRATAAAPRDPTPSHALPSVRRRALRRPWRRTNRRIRRLRPSRPIAPPLPRRPTPPAASAATSTRRAARPPRSALTRQRRSLAPQARDLPRVCGEAALQARDVAVHHRRHRRVPRARRPLALVGQGGAGREPFVTPKKHH